MPADAAASPVAERLVIRGDVGAPTFLPWIERHAAKLGLACRVAATRPDRVEVLASGPPDLLDALEVGCSLGPIAVRVESIERESLPPAN